MIVESIVLGITLIIVSSLVFTNHMVKKERDWGVEDGRPDDPIPLGVVIEPWMFVRCRDGSDDGTRCIKCNVETANASGPDRVKNHAGMFQPETCQSDKCPAQPVSHLHVKCNSCSSKWMMHTADYKAPK